MPPPKTLLELEGAPTHPSALDRSVLVLVDLQREYRDGALPLPGIGKAAEEAATVLALARQRGVPVVHIVHHTAPGAPVFDPDNPLSDILPEVAAHQGEAVVPKGRPNAFAGTDLDHLIRTTGRDEIILVGAMTHICIAATAHAALDLGFRTTVVATACATRDLPGPSGEVIPAAAVQQNTLAGLADRFAIVVPGARAWR